MANQITDLDNAAASPSPAATPPVTVSPAAASSLSDAASPSAAVQTPQNARVQNVLISRPAAASLHPAAAPVCPAAVSLCPAPASLRPASASQRSAVTSPSPAAPHATAFSRAAASSLSSAASPSVAVQTPQHAHFQELEDGEDEILLTAILDYERTQCLEDFTKNTVEKKSESKKRKLAIKKEKSSKIKKNNLN